MEGPLCPKSSSSQDARSQAGSFASRGCAGWMKHKEGNMPKLYRLDSGVWVFCWRIPNGWPGGGLMHFAQSSLPRLLRRIPVGVFVHFHRSLTS